MLKRHYHGIPTVYVIHYRDPLDNLYNINTIHEAEMFLNPNVTLRIA